MKVVPLSLALAISAAGGLASVSLVAPMPSERLGRLAAQQPTASECIGYAKLNLLLRSTRHAEESLAGGACGKRTDGSADAGDKEAGN